jgi:hypothetical protein
MKRILTLALLLSSLNSISQRAYGYSNSSKKELGAAMIVGGVGLSAAMILEDAHSYGTYNQTTKNSVTYVTPPFYKQFPKNVFFVVGIGFTITGLLSLKH